MELRKGCSFERAHLRHAIFNKTAPLRAFARRGDRGKGILEEISFLASGLPKRKRVNLLRSRGAIRKGSSWGGLPQKHKRGSLVRPHWALGRPKVFRLDNQGKRGGEKSSESTRLFARGK